MWYPTTKPVLSLQWYFQLKLTNVEPITLTQTFFTLSLTTQSLINLYKMYINKIKLVYKKMIFLLQILAFIKTYYVVE